MEPPIVLARQVVSQPTCFQKMLQQRPVSWKSRNNDLFLGVPTCFLAEAKYTDLFLGSQYTDLFLGSQYTDLFLGSQYTDLFLGSQYTDLFLEGGESATGWATAAASVEAPPVSSSEKQ